MIRGNISYGSAGTVEESTAIGSSAFSNLANAQGLDNAVAATCSLAAAEAPGDQSRGIVARNISWDRPVVNDPLALFCQAGMSHGTANYNSVSVYDVALRTAGPTFSSSLHADPRYIDAKIDAQGARQPIGPLFEGTPAEFGTTITEAVVNSADYGVRFGVQNGAASSMTLSVWGFRHQAIWQDTEAIAITNAHNNVAGEQTVNVEAPGAFWFHCADSVWGENFPRDVVPEVEVIEAPAGWGYTYSDPRSTAAVSGMSVSCRRFRGTYVYALWIPPGTVGTFRVRFRVTLPFPTWHVAVSPVITINVTAASGLVTRYVDDTGGGDGTTSLSPWTIDQAITAIETNVSTKYLILFKRGDVHVPSSGLSVSGRTALLCFSTWGAGAKPVINSPSGLPFADITDSSNLHFDNIDFAGDAETTYTITWADVSDITLFQCDFGPTNSVMEVSDTGSNDRILLIGGTHEFRRYNVFLTGATSQLFIAIGVALVETASSTAGEGGFRLSASPPTSGATNKSKLGLIAYCSHTTRSDNGKSMTRVGWSYVRTMYNRANVVGWGETGTAGYLSYQFENVVEGNECPANSFVQPAPSEGAVGVSVRNNVLYQESDDGGWTITGVYAHRWNFCHNLLVSKSTSAATANIIRPDSTTATRNFSSQFTHLEFAGNTCLANTDSSFTGTFFRSDLTAGAFDRAGNRVDQNAWVANGSGNRFREANVATDITGWNALTNIGTDQLLTIPIAQFDYANNFLPNAGSYPNYYTGGPEQTVVLDLRGIYRDPEAGSWARGPVGLEANPDAPSLVVAAPVSGGIQLTITSDTTEHIVEYGTATGDYTNWVTDFESGDSITGLTPGQTYYFRVRSRDSLGNISDPTVEQSEDAGAGSNWAYWAMQQ